MLKRGTSRVCKRILDHFGAGEKLNVCTATTVPAVEKSLSTVLPEPLEGARLEEASTSGKIFFMAVIPENSNAGTVILSVCTFCTRPLSKERYERVHMYLS